MFNRLRLLFTKGTQGVCGGVEEIGVGFQQWSVAGSQARNEGRVRWVANGHAILGPGEPPIHPRCPRICRWWIYKRPEDEGSRGGIKPHPPSVTAVNSQFEKVLDPSPVPSPTVHALSTLQGDAAASPPAREGGCVDSIAIQTTSRKQSLVGRSLRYNNKNRATQHADPVGTATATSPVAPVGDSGKCPAKQEFQIY